MADSTDDLTLRATAEHGFPAMQMATLVIALLGVVMAALSLAWQAATFVLSGGRAKAELQWGAVRRRDESIIVNTTSKGMTREDNIKFFRDQGFVRPVVVVVVRNLGRLPITVLDWSIMATQADVLTDIAFSDEDLGLMQMEFGRRVEDPELRAGRG